MSTRTVTCTKHAHRNDSPHQSFLSDRSPDSGLQRPGQRPALTSAPVQTGPFASCELMPEDGPISALMSGLTWSLEELSERNRMGASWSDDFSPLGLLFIRGFLSHKTGASTFLPSPCLGAARPPATWPHGCASTGRAWCHVLDSGMKPCSRRIE